MMKLILFAVIGLLVGIGGGSAVSVMQARKAYAADVARRAKVVADSLAKAEEHGAPQVAAQAHGPDSTAHDSTARSHAGEEVPSHAPPPAVASASAKRTDAPVPTAAQTPPNAASATPRNYSRAVQTVESNGGARALPRTAPPALPAKPIAVAPQPGVAKVAKIFAAMPPKDAAKVLEQLDDPEVQGVISSLNEKQAAAILQNFPAPRAALISKAVLRSAIPAKP